jgi:uncharacterized protein
VKLVVEEYESAALRRFLHGKAVTSCGLARVEVPLAVAERGPEAATRGREVLDGMHLVPLADALLDAAGDLRMPLRSLDAIHVAVARELGKDLECLVSYDRRMAAAAETLGMPVAGPA